MDEKRKRMLDLFHEKKQCFNLKELEKLAPKEKGIVTRSVKEVLQSLVDEDLVKCDMIGVGKFYWTFPSRGPDKSRLDDLTRAIEKESKRLEAVNKRVKEHNPELKKEIAELEKEESNLLKEINALQGSSPEVFEKLKADAQIAKDAANRWTDNIYTVRSWCTNKFFIEKSVIDKHFGLDPYLEYLE